MIAQVSGRPVGTARSVARTPVADPVVRDRASRGARSSADGPLHRRLDQLVQIRRRAVENLGAATPRVEMISFGTAATAPKALITSGVPITIG